MTDVDPMTVSTPSNPPGLSGVDGDTNPGRKLAQGGYVRPGRPSDAAAIAHALNRDADAMGGDLEAIGRDFRKALEPFVEQVRAAVLDKLLPYGCPLCATRTTTAIGAKAHYNVDHSWWERTKARIARWWR